VCRATPEVLQKAAKALVVAGFSARKPSLIQSARNVYRRLHRSQARIIPLHRVLNLIDIGLMLRNALLPNEDAQQTIMCKGSSIFSCQANVAAELVVCHVLLGATGAAERLLHRERDEGFTVWLPSGHKVICCDDCIHISVQRLTSGPVLNSGLQMYQLCM
jgi:hypothetical protein